MPQDDIAAQWKSFDPEKRDRLLKRMSPEQKKKLRGMLEAKPQQNIPATPGEAKRNLSEITSGYDPVAAKFAEKHPVMGGPVRFLSAAGGAALSVPGQIYHSFADPLTEEEKKDFEGHTRIPGEVTLERLTGARQIAEAGKAYANPATRPTLRTAAELAPEALGTGVGSVAGAELTTKAVGKVVGTPAQAKARLQPFLRKSLGIEQAVEGEATKAAGEHAKGLEKQATAKQAAVERGTQARTVDEQSVKVGKQIEQVEAAVGKEADAKFNRVREKLGVTDSTKGPNGEIIPGNPGPSTDPAALVNTVKHAQEVTLQNIPEHIKEFNAILSHEELPTSPDIAAKYGFQLEGPEPLTWKKLQALKSRIDARLRKPGALHGDVLRALYDTREGVVNEMGKMADANGATGEWSAARDWWRQYKENFADPKSPLTHVLDAEDPAKIRRPLTGDVQSTLGNRGAELLRKYPQHGGAEAAAAVEDLVNQNKQLRYMGPEKNPNPPAPKAPVVDAQATALRQILSKSKNIGSYNARDVGIIASSVIAEPIIKAIGGKAAQGASSLLPTAAITYEGGKYAASRLLRNPKVAEWLSRTPPDEANALRALLDSMPGGDKVKVINMLTDEAKSAAKGGKVIQLSAAAKQLLGSSNVAAITALGASNVPKTPGEAKERMRAVQPQPAQ